MTVLLMYLSFGIWFFALITSAYATYRLFEYGPYNANLAWGFVRNITDIATCLALGATFVLSFTDIAGWKNNWIYILILFALGIFFGRLALIVVLRKITAPYEKKEMDKRQYRKERQQAEDQLRKEGLYPQSPNLFKGTVEEWEKYSQALDELRRQGKLPAVPISMQRNNQTP